MNHHVAPCTTFGNIVAKNVFVMADFFADCRSFTMRK